jgi:hypothetical protein
LPAPFEKFLLLRGEMPECCRHHVVPEVDARADVGAA